MPALTLNGLKAALEYVQDNTSLTWYEAGPRKGLIVTDGLSEDEAYHLRVIQSLEPKLIARLAESYAMLSLSGQELLSVLGDDMYVNSLRDELRLRGFSQPSDVQVFKLLRQDIEETPTTSWPDVIKLLVERAGWKDVPVSFEPVTPELTDIPVDPEPPIDEKTEAATASLAESVIKNTKKVRKHVHPAAVA